MLQMSSRPAMDNKITETLIDLVYEVVGDHILVAALVYGSRVAGYARKDSLYDCMAICEYPGGTRYHHKKLKNINVAVLEIDNELFLLDAKKGALGEFIAGRLLFPYISLVGTSYLTEMEVEIKTRVIREEIEDLIQHFGEASRGLIINENFFAQSRILRKSRMYPPLRYSYSNTFCKTLKDHNLEKIMPGYKAAIKRLVSQGILDNADVGISIRDDFIDKSLNRKTKDKVVNIVDASKRALYSYLLHGRAGLVSLDLISREIASKVRRELLRTNINLYVEDPRSYLSLNTANGLIPIDERGTIRDVIFRLRPNSRIMITPLGGVMNEVYLVDVDDEKLVAKIFTDWHGFKWFTLNLVTIGTKFFSVSGKARLANEFGMCHFLRKKGVYVPEVLHVSLSDKILIEKYIEGLSLVDIVKRIVEEKSRTENDFKDIEKIGETIAKIHSLGIQIGDSKPENFLRDPIDNIHVIDLEQAHKGGDFTWDIAEFLYYSGHYATKLNPNIKKLTESFIIGYSKIGERGYLKKASGLNYLKIFSIWTMPQINYILSETLRKI